MDSAFVRKTNSTDWAKYCFDSAHAMVESSIQNNFSLLVFNFHHFLLLDNLKPMKKSFDFFLENPEEGEGSADTFTQYLSFLKWVKNQDLFLASMSEWNEYLRKRVQTRLSSPNWDEENGRLHFALHLSDGDFPFSYMVPMFHKDQKIERITTNCMAVDYKTIFFYGRTYCLFHLPYSKKAKNECKREVEIFYSLIPK
jgi:hypothetical protein